MDSENEDYRYTAAVEWDYDAEKTEPGVEISSEIVLAYEETQPGVIV